MPSELPTQIKTVLYAPELPSTAYVRLEDIIGRDGKRGVLPISRSAFYKGIKEGRFAPPTKIGPRTSAWTVGYVRSLLASFDEEGRDAEVR